MINVTRYIGMRIGDGIIVGAREHRDHVEFDVLDDGERTTHQIPKTTA